MLLSALFTVVLTQVQRDCTNRRSGRPAGSFLHLVEHGITDKKVVLGPAADNTGDGLTFSNPIYEATNTTQIGFDQGYCTRSIVGKSYDCTWTLIFAHSTKADDPDQVGRDRRTYTHHHFTYHFTLTNLLTARPLHADSDRRPVLRSRRLDTRHHRRHGLLQRCIWDAPSAATT